MTTFKTFLKILNKCKISVIMYTVILILFGGFNMETSDNNINFVATKPDVLIVNNDENLGLTKNLIDYIENNSNVTVPENDNSINDALFYRDVNYIIYIPNNYRIDFLNGKDPIIEIKSTGDYQSSLADMMLKRYLSMTNIYRNIYDNEQDIINKVNETLNNDTKVFITTKVDTDSISKASYYYNFLSYSMMAGTIYVICLILSSFHLESIKRRIIVSSASYKEQNRILLFSNSLFALVLWLIYVLLSFVLCGEIMFSIQGFIYIINSLIFTFCCVTIAFFISNLVNNKNAINGIINVLALGSSFLSGAFVPVELLPKSVLTFAHVLPTYWYINTNESLKSIETFDFSNLKPILINSTVIILFSILFIILSNIVSKRKQKYGR